MVNVRNDNRMWREIRGIWKGNGVRVIIIVKRKEEMDMKRMGVRRKGMKEGERDGWEEEEGDGCDVYNVGEDEGCEEEGEGNVDEGIDVMKMRERKAQQMACMKRQAWVTCRKRVRMMLIRGKTR